MEPVGSWVSLTSCSWSAKSHRAGETGGYDLVAERLAASS